MADRNNPLDQLRPIVLPDYDVSAWPLAMGWWILLTIALLLIAGTFVLRPILKARRDKKLQQENTLQLLNNLYKECLQQADQPKALQGYLQGSNEIFKRVVHADQNLLSFAPLTGKDWINFILKVNEKNPDAQTHFAQLYGDTLYASQCHEAIHLEHLHHWASAWSRQLVKESRKIARESRK